MKVLFSTLASLSIVYAIDNKYVQFTSSQNTVAKYFNKAQCKSMLRDGHWSENWNRDEHYACSFPDCSEETQWWCRTNSSNIRTKPDPKICRQNAWKTTCKLRTMTTELTRSCLSKHHILLVGDSRARQIYYALQNFLSGDEMLIDGHEHLNMNFNKFNVKMNWFGQRFYLWLLAVIQVNPLELKLWII